MIIITGGAGFIGSCLQASLAQRGVETVVVDWLGSDLKWRNLAAHAPSRVIAPEDLEAFLATGPKVDAVFHMGAISETTARDADLVWRTNVALTQTLWDWCARTDTRFIYASSAATYGAADRPELFSDDPATLDRLTPLNLYGWSKHTFDQHVMAGLKKHAPQPPQWAGLKFFNVYGPNEYHKGKMISVVKVKYDEVKAGNPARLFRSDRPDIADGQQMRDFIWVGDVVDVMLWLYDTPPSPGFSTAVAALPGPIWIWPMRCVTPQAAPAASNLLPCRTACAGSISPTRRRTSRACGRRAIQARSPRWKTASASMCKTIWQRRTRISESAC